MINQCNCVGFECENCTNKDSNEACFMFDDSKGAAIDWEDTCNKLGGEAQMVFDKFHLGVRSESTDREMLSRLGRVVLSNDESSEWHGQSLLKSLNEKEIVDMLEKKYNADPGTKRKMGLSKDETGCLSRCLCAMLTKDKKVRKNVENFPLYHHVVLPAVNRIKGIFEARRRKTVGKEVEVFHFGMTLDDMINEAQVHQIRCVKRAIAAAEANVEHGECVCVRGILVTDNNSWVVHKYF